MIENFGYDSPKGLSLVLEKHAEHDQSSHGNWAQGIPSELETWNPKDPIPTSPRGSGGMTEKFFDNWERGVEGEQFVDLYRQYAGEMLGLPVPKSDKDVGGSENYLTERGMGASSTKTVRNQTEAVLNAIANSRPQPTLYRGMAANDIQSQILLNQFTSLEQGDTIDMPLVSTTRSLGVAQWYAIDRSYAENDTKVIVKIQEGSKGVSVNPKKSWYPSDHETIVSGKFEVVGKTEVTVPYWSRSAVQGSSFKNRDGEITYRIIDPNNSSWVRQGKPDSEHAAHFKTLVKAINSGDFSKIETSTLKYTNDRNPSGVKEDTGRIIVNSWKREETETFTVIEVKLVEPHVVKKASDKGLTFDKLFSTTPFIRDEEDVTKHAEHDQSSHGNWANTTVNGKTLSGTTVSSLIDKLSEKRTPGFSIDIRTKTSPKDGFIASDKGAERTLDWQPLKDSRVNLRTAIKEYVSDHGELLDGKGSFFGGWVEGGKLYLDVSRRYGSRSEGIGAGFKNEQKAIYDVVNDSYIYMKDEVDERTNKARVGGNSEVGQGNDRKGEGSLRGGNSASDRGQSLSSPHVCLGRYQVQKHREGLHDQTTHGNWAGDRYPEDSVKGARDGALEYSFKKGLKHDETIDYKKVVANRERASKIADIYENLPEMDRDAVDEYEKLASEVEEQFDYMTKTLGVKVEFVADDPYKTSKEMFADVSQGNLKVLSTASTGAHPLFSDLQNDKFRAVHDYFGHAATGRGFGQDGEEAAWVHHSQMFTDKARAALTTETRGQNSFFNNRGKQFADQKVALLPAEFWQVPAIFEKLKQTLRQTNSIIIKFAPELKPILKHASHIQTDHGNWSRGGGEGGKYSAYGERAEAIAAREGALTRQDLDEIFLGIEEEVSRRDIDDFDDDELRMILENDSQYNEEYNELTREEMEAFADNAGIEYDDSDDLEQFREDGEAYAINTLRRRYGDEIAADYGAEEGGFDADSAKSKMRDAFNYKDAKSGMEAQVDEVYADSDSLRVSGYVLGDGRKVGSFIRTFYRDDDGNYRVEHDRFKINDQDYQGKGFGRGFIENQENTYIAAGLNRINLYSAWDGAYTWSRAGYDFNPENIKTAINGLNNDANWETSTWSKSDVDTLTSLRTRGSTYDMAAEDFPFPHEFAALPGAKKALKDLTVYFEKILTPEGVRLREGAIDADGDGMIFDGTPRERPAPSGSSSTQKP